MYSPFYLLLLAFSLHQSLNLEECYSPRSSIVINLNCADHTVDIEHLSHSWSGTGSYLVQDLEAFHLLQWQPGDHIHTSVSVRPNLCIENSQCENANCIFVTYFSRLSPSWALVLLPTQDTLQSDQAYWFPRHGHRWHLHFLGHFP